MEIKEPKFKVGDKVTTLSKVGEALGVLLGTISGIKYYEFPKGTYIYTVKIERDGFTEELHLDELVLDAYIEKPKTVWDLKEGYTYYSIYDNGNVSSEKKWFEYDYENNYREIGNVFLTREEAEFEVERRRIETKMIRLGGRRKFKFDGDNYGIDYCEGLGITLYHYKFLQGLIYFDTLKETEDAIKTIGEDRIKKYIFGVES